MWLRTTHAGMSGLHMHAMDPRITNPIYVRVVQPTNVVHSFFRHYWPYSSQKPLEVMDGFQTFVTLHVGQCSTDDLLRFYVDACNVMGLDKVQAHFKEVSHFSVEEQLKWWMKQTILKHTNLFALLSTHLSQAPFHTHQR